MQCKQCGNLLSEDAQFCNQCGARLTAQPSGNGNTSQQRPPYPSYPQNNSGFYGYPGTGSNPSTPMGVKDYVIMLLLLAIPIVNIILLFVWAFGDDVNLNKKNYCRATLILALVVLGSYIVFFMLAGLGALFLNF